MHRRGNVPPGRGARQSLRARDPTGALSRERRGLPARLSLRSRDPASPRHPRSGRPPVFAASGEGKLLWSHEERLALLLENVGADEAVNFLKGLPGA